MATKRFNLIDPPNGVAYMRMPGSPDEESTTDVVFMVTWTTSKDGRVKIDADGPPDTRYGDMAKKFIEDVQGKPSFEDSTVNEMDAAMLLKRFLQPPAFNRLVTQVQDFDDAAKERINQIYDNWDDVRSLVD